MRVRISYGIDIEEIPEKAGLLGKDAVVNLKESIEQLNKAIDNIEESEGDYRLVQKMLEKVRLKLTKSDLIITDLQAILEGLQNYYKEENNVSERRPIMDPSGDTTPKTEDPGQG